MFQLELRDHLPASEPGVHRAVCALLEGSIEVGQLTSVKVGTARFFAKVVALTRSGESLQRFELLEREVVVSLVVLDAAINANLVRLGAKSLRKQKLKSLTVREQVTAVEAERAFEAAQLAFAAARSALVVAHQAAVDSSLGRFRALRRDELRSYLSSLGGAALLPSLEEAQVTEQDDLVVRFRGPFTFTAEAPARDEVPDERWPESFRRLLQQHARWRFFSGTTDDGLGLTVSELGLPPDFHVQGVGEGEVLCPMSIDGDCYVYHPTLRGPTGEPALSFLSQQGRGRLKPPVPDVDVGALFFRLALTRIEDP